MARTLRRDVFEAETIGVYHCYNRIVRRSFLCGYDAHTGKDYSHRREWFYQRLRYLAEHFKIDVLGYAILSNHYHLVLRNRPDQVERMSDREVVRAWLMICPASQRNDDGTAGEPTEPETRYELNRPGRVAELRGRLSNPSWLIRQLAQHMGIRCNHEDGMSGHFWEARFGMRRLLDDAAILACLAYVDLNPVRAGMTDSLEGYQHVSIGERLRAFNNGPIDPATWLAPLEITRESTDRAVLVVNKMTRKEAEADVRDRDNTPLGCLPISLEDYVVLLKWLAVQDRPELKEKFAGDGTAVLRRLRIDAREFVDSVLNFAKRFSTAVGCQASLQCEATRRHRRWLHAPGRRGLNRIEAGSPPLDQNG